jgi:hypothetical protein
MGGTDVFFPGKIGNRAGDLEDKGVGAGAQPQLVHGHFQKLLRFFIERADSLELPSRESGITKGFLPFVSFEAVCLDRSGTVHPFFDAGRRLNRRCSGHLPITNGGDFDVDIDPVKKRSGDFPAILTYLQSAATAGFVRVGIIAARTPLRCYSVI